MACGRRSAMLVAHRNSGSVSLAVLHCAPGGAHATDQVRVRDQHANGESAWAHDSFDHPGPSRRGDRVRRREVLTVLACAAASVPAELAAQSQPTAGRLPVVSLLAIGRTDRQPSPAVRIVPSALAAAAERMLAIYEHRAFTEAGG